MRVAKWNLLSYFYLHSLSSTFYDNNSADSNSSDKKKAKEMDLLLLLFQSRIFF